MVDKMNSSLKMKYHNQIQIHLIEKCYRNYCNKDSNSISLNEYAQVWISNNCEVFASRWIKFQNFKLNLSVIKFLFFYVMHWKSLDAKTTSRNT